MPPKAFTPAGFFSRLCLWLSVAEAPRPADLIFVFAGKMDRKDYALELFHQGLAPALLVSVGRFEIRRFSQMALPVPLDLLQIAQPVPPAKRHYFVFFQNRRAAQEIVRLHVFGTLSEVRALARWFNRRPEIRSLLIVSSPAHLRRIRLCCRALLDPSLSVTYIAAPQNTLIPSAPALDSAKPSTVNAREDTLSRTALVRELVKLLVYWFVLKFRAFF